MRKTASTKALALCLAFAISGCDWSKSSTTPAQAPYGGYGAVVGQFHDDARTNVQVDSAALDLTFTDTGGRPIELRSYRGKKNIVLVFTRGYAGMVCPNCSAQTSRLIGNYPEFVKRDAEVLVVFPGP